LKVEQAERSAIIAGAVTIVAGAALTLFPERCGKPIGMDSHPAALRRIGVTDLATAPGLIAGRPRWPWMFARAALNAGIAAGAVRYREALGDRTALIAAGTFAVLIGIDGTAAKTLRAAGR